MNERGLPWTRLGLVGAALAFSVLFVHVPAALWAGNAAELHLPIGRVLTLGLVVAVAGTGLFVIVLRRLPDHLRSIVASLAGALGVIEWTYGLLLVGGMQVLDGVRSPLSSSQWFGLWELGLVVAAWLALAALFRRRPGDAVFGLTILNAGLIVVSVATLVTAHRADWTRSDPEPVSRFSPRMNVLVLLLDGLESGVAERVLEADPSLKASFDGFSIYPDTLSTAPTTALSLPAIHSGEVYDGKSATREYFSQAIGRRSFLTQFAHAGYEVSLVHPEQGTCPDGLTTCTTVASVLGTSDRQVRREVLRLFDLSLFRVVPFRAKRWVWDQGRWRASRQAGVPEEVARLIESNEMVDRIGRQLTVDPKTPPTLKFLHSLATHTPYVVNEDCRTVTMEHSVLNGVDVQARCALKAAARLLDRLQGAGIYDNTIALVLADHGLNPGVYPPPQDRASAFRQLYGSANPLFLYKPLRSRGPMRRERGLVSLVDVGATLCAEASACTVRPGVPVGRAPADRSRRFNDYVWQHEFWRTLNIPRVTAYEVRGPLGRPDSWHRLQ